MSDVFMSYAKEDRGKAKGIADTLKRHGLSVWWDRSILPGSRFDTAIEEALDAAKCVIVLWSKTSVSKDWVRTEASEGDRRRILIPVLIDDVTIPLAFRLIQAADLRDWEGKLPHPGFDDLLKAIAGILGRPLMVQPGQGIEPKKVQISILGRPLKVQPSQWIESTQGNSIGMKFTLIPAGEFNMGSEESDDEKPVHKVKIQNPFYLGIYPVTQAEWKAVMGGDNNPAYFKGEDLPVEQVSWDDVQEFIKKFNKKEGTDKYRLPSEAEWEYACRAGTTTKYSFGDSESELDDYAWYHDNSDDKTHPIGQRESNPWGLYDMHGNVWEWVQDMWRDGYDIAPADGSAWESGDGAARVARGGGWRFGAGLCRSASRRCAGPSRRGFLGFRLLQEL